MRLWSIDFSYLDPAGLVALWREALLAKKVLQGKTKGYRNHPQLERFKALNDPLEGINTYLYYVLKEGELRGYNFDGNKIDLKKVNLGLKINVKRGQIKYEFSLLKYKLSKRNKDEFEKLKKIRKVKAMELFRVVNGGIEYWERPKLIKFS